MVVVLSKRINKLGQVFRVVGQLKDHFWSSSWLHSVSETKDDIETIARIINDHPFPVQPLQPTLKLHISPSVLSAKFVENVLGRLFAAHANGLKAYEFFEFCLRHSEYSPTSDAFEKTLHILARMRYFDKVWELMKKIQQLHPSLLTLKSLSIVLSRIAKHQSYEDALEAFEKMEKHLFPAKKFGTEEFNILLRAFCTQRQMKEARSIFNKLHSRFPPDTKTMNILLLGFKESGDITAVELFYHEMVKRGFKPNNVTHGIRIDAYCKKGHLGDALKLFEEMERVNCLPTVQTITTLIHGAGIARNIAKAKELFNEIYKRNLQPDTGAYNALVSSLIKSRDVKSAAGLMDEMEEKNIELDHLTYHTMFWGLIRSKDVGGVIDLYEKMIDKNFLPKARTVVTLMKFFCENRRLDLGLSLWNYLMDKGHCPHCHSLEILVTGLCSRGRVEEAFECSEEMLKRGRHMSELVYQMLKRSLLQLGEEEKLQKLYEMTKRLEMILPPYGQTIGHSLGADLEVRNFS
ncbi:pentatricopeptide repeat-containing protein At3g61360 [Nicotiana tabacum]|uniref:Pentatricopeptide repeat-containing protein At3g61360 n=5 Tax=Nicotiana TaxID=4085 RepID=A0A1S3XT32_TOBAC|nr:PREDICTED: pentatricopeptide repeat-containing protein At3g61360 [Nicotiana sylvestris]XP_009789280.1 PREDICTED: pentatricopeptide repeat-containing protein At3g61360 [Nicotiana sylvestris]XP_009789281.1 PREDICTED: pentatricopeptide repeat-containing protein At3g61360 [Nicotiana sylvestris]XP_009789282.1 PREDICTED: pentatricopeptide repeat-containing protein At3g61360 [Nicotiana sylvestris]